MYSKWHKKPHDFNVLFFFLSSKKKQNNTGIEADTRKREKKKGEKRFIASRLLFLE